MTENVAAFFGRSDEFLRAQFDHLIGESDDNSVLTARSALVSCLQEMSFVQTDYAKAQQQWLAVLDGLSISMGFEQLRNLKPETPGVESCLQTARDQIDASRFLSLIGKF